MSFFRKTIVSKLFRVYQNDLYFLSLNFEKNIDYDTKKYFHFLNNLVQLVNTRLL